MAESSRTVSQGFEMCTCFPSAPTSTSEATHKLTAFTSTEIWASNSCLKAAKYDEPWILEVHHLGGFACMAFIALGFEGAHSRVV